jgi:hypothetical protein
MQREMMKQPENEDTAERRKNCASFIEFSRSIQWRKIISNPASRLHRRNSPSQKHPQNTMRGVQSNARCSLSDPEAEIFALQGWRCPLKARSRSRFGGGADQSDDGGSEGEEGGFGDGSGI